MSLGGKLEETSLPEVLRRLSAEGRSGTLRLSRGALRARIGLRHGRPVSVRAPGLKRLGDLLVAAGLADPITVQAAARSQAEERGRRPLGQILIANGVLAADSLERMVRQQIEHALADLSTWPSGRFEFATDEPFVLDDLNLDLAATGSAPAAEAGPADSTRPAPPGSAPAPDRRALLPGRAAAARVRFGDSPHLVEILSTDAAFAQRLVERLSAGASRLRPGSAEADAFALPRLLLVADLRRGERPVEELAQLRRRHPGVPIFAVLEAGGASSAAYAAGATAVVPIDPEAVAAAVANWIEVTAESPLAELAPFPSAELLLGRVFDEIRPGSTGATVALDLMQAVSESAERAVLFLLRRNRLVAAGAFGSREDGRSLAELTRGLRLDLEGEPALQLSLEIGRPHAIAFEGGELPASLARLLGRPRSGEGLVVPVAGAETLVAMIYADNGPVEQGIADLLGLELAAARFGPPLETELLIGEAARTLG
jgi:hypothetical protein